MLRILHYCQSHGYGYGLLKASILSGAFSSNVTKEQAMLNAASIIKDKKIHGINPWIFFSFFVIFHLKSSLPLFHIIAEPDNPVSSETFCIIQHSIRNI